MENEVYTEQGSVFETELQIDSESRTYLRAAAKWARFLGIAGFIFSGFALLVILVFWYANSASLGRLDVDGTNRGIAAFGVGFVIIIYTIIAVISFFVSLFTFRFGQRTYRALRSDSQADLKSGLSHLRLLFRLYGILAIIYFAFISMGIIFSIIR